MGISDGTIANLKKPTVANLKTVADLKKPTIADVRTIADLKKPTVANLKTVANHPFAFRAPTVHLLSSDLLPSSSFDPSPSPSSNDPSPSFAPANLA
nr:hypothetical protein CFP56_70275 [Quercus suber]